MSTALPVADGPQVRPAPNRPAPAAAPVVLPAAAVEASVRAPEDAETAAG